MSATSHHEVQYADYKETVATSKKTYKTNKNAYIMRNQEMIDASDTDNKDYLPPKRKQSKWSVLVYQPQSGTAIAYAYAKQEKKQIINLYE